MDQSEKSDISPHTSYVSDHKYIRILVYILIGVVIVLLYFTYLIFKKTYKNPSISNKKKIIPTTILDTTENERETLEWKTYTNIKYGYTFKYKKRPGIRQFTCGEKLGEEGGQEKFALDPSNITLTPCGGQEWFDNVQINVESGNSATKEYFKSADFQKNLGSDWKIITADITIASSSAVKASLISTFTSQYVAPPPNFTQIRVFHDKYTYIITLANNADTLFTQIFNDITSSFTFTDIIVSPKITSIIPTVHTTETGQYKNEVLHYGFIYPTKYSLQKCNDIPCLYNETLSLQVEPLFTAYKTTDPETDLLAEDLFCNASGPHTNVICKNTKVEKFTNSQNVIGYKVYRNKEITGDHNATYQDIAYVYYFPKIYTQNTLEWVGVLFATGSMDETIYDKQKVVDFIASSFFTFE